MARSSWRRRIACGAGVCVFLAATGAARAHAQGMPGSSARVTVRQDADERGRFGDYVNDLVGFWALFGIAARSTYDQAVKEPDGWDDDSEGFGKRVGQRLLKGGGFGQAGRLISRWWRTTGLV